MPFFMRRAAEYFLSEFLISAFFAIFLQNGAKEPSILTNLAAMGLGIVLNIIYLSICLEAYWISVRNKILYYRVNIVVLMVFMVFNMLVLAIEPLYTYMFFHYKILTLFGVNKLISALVIHLIMLINIIALPKKIFSSRETL